MALAIQAIRPASAPPMPYEDPGACPFECCMTGLVRTTSAGEVRITEETVLDVHVPNGFERIPLAPGSRLYLLTPHGEGFMRGWHEGRPLDSFDTSKFDTQAECDRSPRCVGVIEKSPQREWWVEVRNQRGQIGWVLMPQDKRAFRGNDACGG